MAKTFKKRSASTLRRLHRSLGASAAAFVIFLVLSGIVINHSNTLGLDKRQVSQDALLSWYGLEKPENIPAFRVADRWISFAGSQVFLDEKPVAALSNGVGAAAAANILVVAGSEEILLLDDSGQLIERQTWGRSPGDPVTSIGLLPNGNVIIKTNHGAWQPDADFIGWARVEDATADPDWSRAQPLPASLMQAVSRSYRGHGLSFERVLLDLHSGRFFGAFGVLVYDLVAIVLGFLAVSGLVLWFRGRRNVKRQSNHVNRR